jgi:hypothetical protein
MYLVIDSFFDARWPTTMAFEHDRDRLESLPQDFDIWQLDARQATTTLRAGDHVVRPWMIVVVDLLKRWLSSRV